MNTVRIRTLLLLALLTSAALLGCVSTYDIIDQAVDERDVDTLREYLNETSESYGQNPLMRATECGNIAFMQLLMAEGANLSLQEDAILYQDDSLALIDGVLTFRLEFHRAGKNCLYYAVHFNPYADQANRIEAADLLIHNGAAVDAEIFTNQPSDWVPEGLGFSPEYFGEMIANGAREVGVIGVSNFWVFKNSEVRTDIAHFPGNRYNRPD